MMFSYLPRLSGRVFAVFTALSMIISMMPVFAPNLLAATNLSGPDSASFAVDGDNLYESAEIDATTVDVAYFGFDFDGPSADNNDSVEYGWKRTSDSTEHVLGEVNFKNGTSNDTGSVYVTLPGEALVDDLIVFIQVSEGMDAGDDAADFTNIVVEGEHEPAGAHNTRETAYTNPTGNIDYICHATGEDTYVENPPNLSSIVKGQGHGGDADDIIPPFWYQFDESNAVDLYLGLNWNEDTQAIYENGCEAPIQTPTAELKIVKEVVGGELEPGDWIMSASSTENGEYDFAAPGDSTDFQTVVAGVAYEMNETTVEGYTLTDISCEGRGVEVDGNTIVLTEGSRATCTFTNTLDEEPKQYSDVTICKQDMEANFLAGWTVSLTEKNVGAYSATGTTEDTNGDVGNGCYTFEAVPYGDYIMGEDMQEGWENYSGDGEVVTVDEETETFYIVNKPIEVIPVCEDENPGWADEVVAFDQAAQKGGDPVAVGRSDAEDALDAADWTSGDSTGFVSLGMGGSITVKFDKYVPDVDGDDISIHEATNGTYPLEKAQVEVSQDGSDWEVLSEEARNDVDEGGDSVTLLDIAETGFLWIKYVRITDTTDPALHTNGADGYDLDAIDATQELCDEPKEEEKEAELEITNPATDYETLTGEHTFEGEYTDVDDETDDMRWAIRFGTCDAGEATVAGNVDGFDDPFDWDGALFSANVDMNSWDNGEYCLVLNPDESSGDDLREERWFVLENTVGQCTLVALSDTGTLVFENNDYAVETNDHDAWTAVIEDATWIWDSYYVENPDENETRTFVETFTVINPATSTLQVAADNGYEVYLNDVLIADRTIPTYTNNFQTHSQKEYDVTDEMISGENKLVIVVTNLGVDGANAISNPAGLLYRLEVIADDEAGSCVITTEPDRPSYLIDGYKWNDEDGDGIWDEGETPIAGWGIYANQGETELATTTDQNGYYYFEVEPGYWDVSEEERAGWTQTAPGPIEDEDYGWCEYYFIDPDQQQVERVLEWEWQNPESCDFGNQENDDDTNGDAPSCNFFNVDPNEVEPNDTFYLNWDTSNATYVEIDNGIGVVDVDGSVGVFASEDEGVYTYTLTALNDDDDEVSCQTTIEVVDDGSSSGTRLGSRSPQGQVLGESVSCGMYLYDYMRMGIPNDRFEVVKLQLFLTQQGFFTPVTGIFDSTTDTSVRSFQEVHREDVLVPWFEAGIVPHSNPTGYVYKTTRWKINNIVCPGIEDFPSFEGETL